MQSNFYRKSSYSNKGCRCKSGHYHRSKGEAGYCNDLQKHVDDGIIESFDCEKRFDLHGINGRKISSHKPDFLIHNFDGTQEVHEYKGYETELWRLKKTLFELEYPDIPYIVIKHKGWRK